MQESSDILNLLENLRIVALVNILNQLFKDLFYVFDLLLVGRDDLLFIHKPLLLSLVLSFEFNYDVLFFLIYFSLEFGEPVVDIVELNLHQALQLFFDLAKQALILLDQPIRVIYHLSKINYILFQGIAHFIDLHQSMPVMVVVDTL